MTLQMPMAITETNNPFFSPPPDSLHPSHHLSSPPAIFSDPSSLSIWQAHEQDDGELMTLRLPRAQSMFAYPGGQRRARAGSIVPMPNRLYLMCARAFFNITIVNKQHRMSQPACQIGCTSSALAFLCH